MSNTYYLPEEPTTSDESELQVNSLVRISYKKEKQANYRARIGIIKEVSKNPNGTIESLLVLDFTTDTVGEYLEQPELRRFKWDRIGDYEVFPEVAQSTVVPHNPNEVKFTLPAGHIALVKIQPTKGNE